MQTESIARPKRKVTAGERITGFVILGAIIWAIAACTAGALNSSKPSATPAIGPIAAFPSVVAALEGTTNLSQPRLRKFEHFPDTGKVNVDFNIDDNLTVDMVRSGIEMQMSRIYTAVYHGNGPTVRSASVHAWGPVTDKYGNHSYADLVGTTLDADVARRINWNAASATLELDVIPGLWVTFRSNASLGWPATSAR